MKNRPLLAQTLLFERFGLANFAHDLASNLSYGAQRRLEIVRDMANAPWLLLLDEPAAGMNPQGGHELEQLIRSLNNDGLTLLLIEHDMRLAMRLADHIWALDYGRLFADGPPKTIRTNASVIRAYIYKER